MSLWGTTTADSDKPKFLPVDSNAAGSTGAREHLIASKSGWALSPGLAASGNDNADAQPEILVCIKNLAEAMGNASIISIDWSDGEVADTGTFDIVVTFDEAVDMTSAARTANQTVTNKAYILLSRLGATDMVEDSTVACQYYSGDGTNQLTFRGLLQTGSAAYLGFNGSGIGDDAFSTGIIFDGTSAMDEEDGNSALGLRQEAGTAASPSFGDSIVLDSVAAIVGTVNGAITTATTALVLDGNSGTIAVGMKVYGQNNATPLTDENGSTDLSQDGSLTVAATNGSTSVTLNKAVTVANDVILNFSADGHDEIIADGISFTVAGPSFATRSDITTVARTGQELGGNILLEIGVEDTDDGEDHIILDGTDGSSTNAGSTLDLEDFTSGVATYLQAGSTSGTAYVLAGIDIAAS